MYSQRSECKLGIRRSQILQMKELWLYLGCVGQLFRQKVCKAGSQVYFLPEPHVVLWRRLLGLAC
jgi:hypothetical protein